MSMDNYLLARGREKSTGRIVTVSYFGVDGSADGNRTGYENFSEAYRGFAVLLFFKRFYTLSEFLNDISREHGVTEPLFSDDGDPFLGYLPYEAIPDVRLLLSGDKPYDLFNSDSGRDLCPVEDRIPECERALKILDEFMGTIGTGKFSGTRFEKMIVDEDAMRAIERAPEEFTWDFAHGYDY